MKDSQPLNRDMVYVFKYIKESNERFSTGVGGVFTVE